MYILCISSVYPMYMFCIYSVIVGTLTVHPLCIHCGALRIHYGALRGVAHFYLRVCDFFCIFAG